MKKLFKPTLTVMISLVAVYYGIRYHLLQSQYEDLSVSHELAISRIDAYKNDIYELIEMNGQLGGDIYQFATHLDNFKEDRKKYGKDKEVKLSVITASVTAYNADINQSDGTPFITASNKLVRDGIVAVSPDLFANGWTFGKQVIVDGRFYTIEDLTSSKLSKTVDIFMWDRGQAVKFGRKRMKVALAENVAMR